MTNPHGAKTLTARYVADDGRRAALLAEANGLPAILLNSAAASNAVMLGSGYFTPLAGYMNLAEATRVAESMTLPSGALWPVPVLNMTSRDRVTPDHRRGKRIALRDPGLPGNPVLAVQEVAAIEEISTDAKQYLIEKVFRTTDSKHPGVADFSAAGDVAISGPIEVLNYSYFPAEFPETFRTAGQIREAIASRGWKKVVAFQTRNPMHRAHEELCKMAMAGTNSDGLLIHMVLGKLKPGDIPAGVRDAAIRKMVELYFPAGSAMIAGYGFDMLYAGPREAVLHAIIRQNAGCSYLIVGRDHAGVGTYYGAFDAQAIFESLPPNSLEIQIFKADHTAWSKKVNKVVMMRDYPDHKPEDYINLSGTKVRDTLAAGQPLPAEFARPEVAAILMKHYQQEAGR